MFYDLIRFRMFYLFCFHSFPSPTVYPKSETMVVCCQHLLRLTQTRFADWRSVQLCLRAGQSAFMDHPPLLREVAAETKSSKPTATAAATAAAAETAVTAMRTDSDVGVVGCAGLAECTALLLRLAQLATEKPSSSDTQTLSTAQLDRCSRMCCRCCCLSVRCRTYGAGSAHRVADAALRLLWQRRAGVVQGQLYLLAT